MAKEIYDLDTEALENLHKRVCEIMLIEFGISKESIIDFWNTYNIGAEQYIYG